MDHEDRVGRMAAGLTGSGDSASETDSRDDPWAWLEDVTGERALGWVAEQNTRSQKAIAETEDFRSLNARFLGILDSDARIPYVRKVGGAWYNFWRDPAHELGLWRRTSLAEYRKEAPAWETVLDLDALSAAEDVRWVWHGAQVLRPDATRCLVMLSKGGADANVVREFDLATKSFVIDGFVLPEAKSSVAWRGRDALYVATEFGPGSMTTSGYPRIVKEWTRGTPLGEAAFVFEGEPTDVAVGAHHDPTPGFERDFVYRAITFYSNELFLRRDGRLIRIDKPDDAEASVHREWLLIQLRSDWTTGGRTWPAGSLLVTRFDDFLAGSRELAPLFTPGERTSLASFSTTRSAILVNELDHVRNRVFVLAHADGEWTRTPMPGLPDFGSIEASAIDDLESDDYFLTLTDFVTPTSLLMGTAGGSTPERLKHSPSFFDAAGLTVSQHEAVSEDGTRVPYFEVRRGDRTLDGTAPTMMTGYGGFEVSLTPYYSGIAGAGWLERGGVMVLANIRGGGEFGPRWHDAAVKQNRGRSYEDFIAIAGDLIRRRVTSPAHLGCIGGSNGGLLVGNMLTRRPDLFGAIVCEAPLLDMRRYSKLLAGASWIGEYGDPDVPAEWAFIRTFSPYHNVAPDAAYPPILFTSSTRDDRVHPGHARKMVAKMTAQGHDVLYYENVEGGHAGAADNKQQAYMSALAYRFLWEKLTSKA